MNRILIVFAALAACSFGPSGSWLVGGGGWSFPPRETHFGARTIESVQQTGTANTRFVPTDLELLGDSDSFPDGVVICDGLDFRDWIRSVFPALTMQLSRSNVDHRAAFCTAESRNGATERLYSLFATVDSQAPRRLTVQVFDNVSTPPGTEAQVLAYFARPTP